MRQWNLTWSSRIKIAVTASGLVRQRVNERSSFVATANFFTDSAVPWTAAAPTNAQYRLDRIYPGDPNCWQVITDWTTLSVAASIPIPISASQNSITDNCARSERRQLTVRADNGLSTQTEQTFLYSVDNLAGST